MSVAALVADLRGVLPAGAVVAEAGELPAYGQDFWALRGVPGAVVRVTSAEVVRETLRFAARHGVPVVPRAAGTNVSAGFLPTPERIMLDLRPMNRVVTIDPERREAVVEPGLINGELQKALAPHGLYYSPDPASAAFSSIGGNIAENAGGPHCLKYGVTVHHVNGVECALIGGESLRLAASDAGPDLLGVVIGSEGTLGIVTGATLNLLPLPAVTRTLLAVFDDADAAARAVSAIIAAGVVPAALEYCDNTAIVLFERYERTGYPADAAAVLLIDIDGDADEVARDLAATEAILRRGAREVRRADDAATSAALWRGRRQGAQALLASGMGYFICDTTVPRERIPEMQRRVAAIAERHGLLIPTLGHAGDGNIHPIVLYDRANPAGQAAMALAERELAAAALELGGTITGEHGVGSEKLGDMADYFGRAELAAMRAVKGAFDPAGLLNPGVLLPPPVPGEPELPRFAAAVRGALDARRDGGKVAAGALPEVAIGDGEAFDLDGANLTVTVGTAMRLDALHTRLTAQGYRVALPGGEATVGELVGGGEHRARRCARRCWR
ncbi:MAG: FAD-linked oxidase C-terminal domain-containing protein [Thermomicrobiales bacterium]